MMSLGFGLGLTNRLASAAPPVPFAATILPDGVTARVLFTGHVISGSATAGLTFDTAISAGAYAGITLDLTVGLVTIDASGLALVYDAGVGSLAGVSGPISSFTISVSNTSWSGGALWTPASHGTNLDYGIDSDLTRLFKTNAFTTPVTAPGDPVVRWRGQRNVLHFAQGTAANQPSYQPGGVVFDTSGGVAKQMFSTYALNHNAPAYCLIFQTVSDRVLGGGGSLHTFAPTGSIRTGVVALAAEQHFYAVGKNLYTETTQDTLGETVVGSSWDGTSLTFFDNDADATVVGADASTVNPTGFNLGVLGAVTGVKSRTHAWAVGNGVITADDYKKHAWWARYTS